MQRCETLLWIDFLDSNNNEIVNQTVNQTAFLLEQLWLLISKTALHDGQDSQKQMEDLSWETPTIPKKKEEQEASKCKQINFLHIRIGLWIQFSLKLGIMQLMDRALTIEME